MGGRAPPAGHARDNRACLAMDGKRLSALSRIPARRRRGRRIQRQVHGQPDGPARRLRRDDARTCEADLPQLLPPRQALAIFRLETGARHLEGNAMLDEGGPSAPVIDRAVADAALSGLQATPKTLPPKLFYDEEGCRLFYRITELPEYYLTRAEREPLSAAALHLGRLLESGTVLVEYGASSEEKALRLLAAQRDGRMLFSHYIPVDVAASALAVLRRRLAEVYPGLSVQPVIADFTASVALPEITQTRPCLGFFPGSTIGNLEPTEAEAFMGRVRSSL